MNLNPINPQKALNKAFLKLKPTRDEIGNFKAQLIRMLDQRDETETEEFPKSSCFISN